MLLRSQASPHSAEPAAKPEQRQDVDPPGPEPRRQPGADGHDHAQCQRVGVLDPLDLVRGRREVALHGGDRDVDDADVEHRHEHADDQHGERDTPAPVRRGTARSRPRRRGGRAGGRSGTRDVPVDDPRCGDLGGRGVGGHALECHTQVGLRRDGAATRASTPIRRHTPLNRCAGPTTSDARTTSTCGKFVASGGIAGRASDDARRPRDLHPRARRQRAALPHRPDGRQLGGPRRALPAPRDGRPRRRAAGPGRSPSTSPNGSRPAG